jgi:hypothetical protein
VDLTDLRQTLIDAGKASTGPRDTLPLTTCFGAQPPLDGALLTENALLDRGRLYKIAHPGRSSIFWNFFQKFAAVEIRHATIAAQYVTRSVWRLHHPGPGEAKGAGGLSMAAQNAREGRGLDSEQAVELMKG